MFISSEELKTLQPAALSVTAKSLQRIPKTSKNKAWGPIGSNSALKRISMLHHRQVHSLMKQLGFWVMNLGYVHMINHSMKNRHYTTKQFKNNQYFNQNAVDDKIKPVVDKGQNKTLLH